MKRSGKPGDREALRCECECKNCEIGAHERCHSAECKMPKWKDIQNKTPTRKAR
jgi:hypothetical protein